MPTPASRIAIASVIEEALLNGLTADARAFIGVPPPSLSDSEADRARFVDGFTRHKAALLESFQRYRPSDTAYSPLSFFFNFSHNVVKGAVVDALLWGEAWDVSMNDLLTGVPRAGLEEGSQQLLATTLMAYARSNPDRIRGKLMPVIVYDPQAGRRAYTVDDGKTLAVGTGGLHMLIGVRSIRIAMIAPDPA